jgi:hypothetical protein
MMHVQVGGPRQTPQSPQGYRAGITGPLSRRYNGVTTPSLHDHLAYHLSFYRYYALYHVSVPCASLRRPVVSHIVFSPKPVTPRLYHVYVAE